MMRSNFHILVFLRPILWFAIAASFVTISTASPVPKAVSAALVCQDDLAADKDENSINEQTIYVPYDKLRSVFEKDGRGVFIPYDKFQRLWREARRNQPKPIDSSAPLGAVITDIESIASLGKEIISVDATIKIEMLRKGWHRVPLRLKNAAIRSAKIGERDARIVTGQNNDYELLVEQTNEDSQSLTLELSYAKALEKTRGQSTVSLQAPQAPVNRWIIRTGQKGIDVDIEPMIATTRKESPEQGSTPQDSGDEILAFIGAAPNVTIRWTPKSEGATGLAALLSAETQQRISIDQGVARTSANVAIDISRSEIKTLEIAVPIGQKIVNVFDRNLKKWDVIEKGDEQIVSIELFEPAIGRQNLALELEKFIDDIESHPVQTPAIRVLNASRNQGIVLVGLTGGLRAETSMKKGLLQIDKAELPKALSKQNWNFAFRYASLPYSLTLDVQKIQPLINVEQWIQVAVEPQRLSAELDLVYDIKKAGVFQFQLDISDDYEIREIRPSQTAGVTGASIDAYYKDENNENRWIITLSRKGIGKIGLKVVLQRELADPNLLSPTGVASELDMEIPKATLEGIEFSNGHVVILAPESLQVNAPESLGLRSVSFQKALGGRRTLSPSTQSTRPVLAYEFSNSDATLGLRAKRRKPLVTVEQLMIVSIESGVVKYDSRLNYDIRYSGVKTLRLDVPTALVDQIHRQTSSIHHAPMAPQPDDVQTGYTAWELSGEKEFFGKHPIRFSWESKTAELPLGESLDVQVDRLIPMAADRASGTIVTTKSESIDIRPMDHTSGLRPVDPQTDLPNGVKVADASMAFEFVDDWNLGLTATRYELEDLKRTSISRSLIRVVSLRHDELSVQALYNIRSVAQRIAIQMPTGFSADSSFDDQPIRVNGQRVTPERGGNGLIYIPLTAQSSDAPFLLELRYSIPGTHQQIDLPVFPDDPAIQKVFLAVYLPHENALVSKSGQWTDQAIDVDNHMFSRMFNRRTQNVDSLMTWVKEGTTTEHTVQKFETDGRPYIFSSLRPASPPDGSLTLRTMNLTLLNTIACLVIVGVGLVMLRRRFEPQLIVFALLLVAVVLLGLFFPLITEHLFSPALTVALGGVAATWIVADLGRWYRATKAERIAAREEAEILAAERAETERTETVAADSNHDDESQSPAPQDEIRFEPDEPPSSESPKTETEDGNE